MTSFSVCFLQEDSVVGEDGPLVGRCQGEVRLEVGGGHQNLASSLRPLPPTSGFLGPLQTTGRDDSKCFRIYFNDLRYLPYFHKILVNSI